MTEVLNTQIIYNAAAAAEEVARVDAEQPLRNQQNTTFNKWLRVFLSGIPISTSILAIWLFLQRHFLQLKSPMWACIIVMVIGVYVANLLYQAWSREVLPQYQWYTANADYYRITNGNTVLRHSLIAEPNDQYTLHVEMEDESHVVFDDFVLSQTLTGETRTDITEVTVDLVQGKVFLPYK